MAVRNYRKLFEYTLEAFATGDAMGMPTEFMDKETIRKRYKIVESILDPSESFIHRNLRKGQVTDDTEQVLYLIDMFSKNQEITPRKVAQTLYEWAVRTRAKEKGYIGPSSLKALEKIREGVKPEEAGKNGTTCGAAMRVLAPALCVKKGDLSKLRENIFMCSIPTHNTNLALEAAMALGYGYHFAAIGSDFDQIIDAIIQGAVEGYKMSSNKFIGASTGERVRFVTKIVKRDWPIEKVLDFIYDVIGTSMASNEVVPAAVTIFMYAKDDVWLAIRMGASVGGDTDTIAAMAGALCCLYAGGHNIPSGIVEEVINTNSLNLEKYAEMIEKIFCQ